MTYRFEFFPKEDSLAIHITEKIVESYISPAFGKHELFTLLKGAKGLSEVVSLQPYQISIEFGMAFKGESVGESVVEILKFWFQIQGYHEEWVRRSDIRTDIACIQCSKCKELEDEVWERW